jgi:hypothetical protein
MPKSGLRAARLQRSATRLARLGSAIRPTRNGDPVGRPEPRRRLLSGQTVPASQTGLTWHELIAPGPPPTGGAKADPNHPSRKHDTSS